VLTIGDVEVPDLAELLDEVRSGDIQQADVLAGLDILRVAPLAGVAQVVRQRGLYRVDDPPPTAGGGEVAQALQPRRLGCRLGAVLAAEVAPQVPADRVVLQRLDTEQVKRVVMVQPGAQAGHVEHVTPP